MNNRFDNMNDSQLEDAAACLAREIEAPCSNPSQIRHMKRVLAKVIKEQWRREQEDNNFSIELS